MRVKVVGNSLMGVFMYPKNMPLEMPKTRASEISKPL
jgi:hypothetical protein